MELTNGKIYGCDFIVSATGVTPNVKSSFDSDIEVRFICYQFYLLLEFLKNYLFGLIQPYNVLFKVI